MNYIDEDFVNQSRPDFTQDLNDNIWSAYSISRENDDQGYLCLENLNNGKKIVLTHRAGVYHSVKVISDKQNRLWVLYCQYSDGLNEIKVIKYNTENKKINNYDLTDFGKYDNPSIAIQNNVLEIVWESYSDSDTYIAGCRFSTEKSSLLQGIDRITVSRSYKPILITDINEKLYLIYELYSQSRYKMMARVKNPEQEVYSPAFEIGFNSFNDLEASACRYKDKIVVAWENSKPLEKNYVWEKKNGENVIIPAFGHGWRVESKIGVRVIRFKDGSLQAANLEKRDTPIVSIPSTGSTGSPTFKIDREGRLYIIYLSCTEGRLWEINIKLFASGEWRNIDTEYLISGNRVNPAVFYDSNNDGFFIFAKIEEQDTDEEIKFLKLDDYLDNENLKDGLVKYLDSGALPGAELLEEFSLESTEKKVFDTLLANDQVEIATINYQDQDLKVWWGDLHMHSNISPCSLNPAFHCTEIKEKYRYSRDVGGLDFAMVTDHDRMTDYKWQKTLQAAAFNNLEEGFISFVGFEWTSSMMSDHENYGHFNVLYPESGPLYRCDESEADTPVKLWEKVAPYRSITIPHHPSDKKHPVNWDYYNPDMEPLVEIFQVRGSYEADQCQMYPTNYGRPVLEGHSVREALDRGYKLGFTSGGEHEGVGVTAVLAPKLNRESLYDALKARHTYGTTGARILMDFRVNGQLMGEEIVVSELIASGQCEIEFNIIGTTDIDQIRLIKDGEEIKSWTDMESHVEISWYDKDIISQLKDFSLNNQKSQQENINTQYYYLVVKQKDGEMAWSSPVFIGGKQDG